VAQCGGGVEEHLAGLGNSVQYSSDVSCHVISGCIPKSQVVEWEVDTG